MLILGNMKGNQTQNECVELQEDSKKIKCHKVCKHSSHRREQQGQTGEQCKFPSLALRRSSSMLLLIPLRALVSSTDFFLCSHFRIGNANKLKPRTQNRTQILENQWIFREMYAEDCDLALANFPVFGRSIGVPWYSNSIRT
jgi:hypothetical protein